MGTAPCARRMPHRPARCTPDRRRLLQRCRCVVQINHPPSSQLQTSGGMSARQSAAQSDACVSISSPQEQERTFGERGGRASLASMPHADSFRERSSASLWERHRIIRLCFILRTSEILSLSSIGCSGIFCACPPALPCGFRNGDDTAICAENHIKRTSFIQISDKLSVKLPFSISHCPCKAYCFVLSLNTNKIDAI